MIPAYAWKWGLLPHPSSQGYADRTNQWHNVWSQANPLTATGFQSSMILATLLPERGHLAFKQVLATRCEAISDG